jgi:ABC-2 type transport system permease protein
MQKDFIVLRRDLRNLSHLVTPLIFGIIYAAAFLRNAPASPTTSSSTVDLFLHSLLAYSNVGVALFAGWNLLIRLGGMAFSLEGKNYWLLKAAPLHTWHLITAKFLVAYLPALAMGTIFMGVVSIIQHISIFSFLYSLLVTALCLAEMAGVMVAFGAVGANLTWDDPRKMASGPFGCLGVLATAILTVFAFLLFIAPSALVSFLGLPETYGYLSGLLLGGVFSVGCAFVPLLLVYKKVEQLGEA